MEAWGLEGKCRKTMRYKDEIAGLDINYVDTVSDVNPLVNLAKKQTQEGGISRHSLETSVC